MRITYTTSLLVLLLSIYSCKKKDASHSPKCTATSYYHYLNKDFILSLPTAFTPNGDGRNDLFRGVTTDSSITDYKLIIYDDQTGAIVKQIDNVMQAWDGSGSNGYRHSVSIHFKDSDGNIVDTCGYVYKLPTCEDYRVKVIEADIAKYFFEDQFDVNTGLAPYQTAEIFCN